MLRRAPTPARLPTVLVAGGVLYRPVVSLSTRPFHLHPTSPLYFDIKQYKLEQRRLRELEKAGIDPDDEEPWIAPEEQQRLDEEKAQREAEEEERRKAYLAKRDAEDELKRQRFKEFRAKQVAMSRQRKKENAEAKAGRQTAGDRVVIEDVDEEPPAAVAESEETNSSESK